MKRVQQGRAFNYCAIHSISYHFDDSNTCEKNSSIHKKKIDAIRVFLIRLFPIITRDDVCLCE